MGGRLTDISYSGRCEDMIERGLTDECNERVFGMDLKHFPYSLASVACKVDMCIFTLHRD